MRRGFFDCWKRASEGCEMLFEMSAEISGLVRGALEAVPTPPDSWHPMLRELGLGPATLVN